MFPTLALHSALMSSEDAAAKASDPDHGTRAAGAPWCFLGCSTKKEAIARYGCGLFGPSVLNATLKDEIRPKGKDARLFRPVSVHDYIRGLCLFNSQNEYIANQIFTSPVFVKYVTPGRDLTLLYTMLKEHGGDLYDADSTQWDARFPLVVAEIIATWRSRFLPQDAVIDYYSDMFAGFTLVGGHLFRLAGQPSGQVNTTIDNSLANIVLMALHAYNCRMEVSEFLSDVLFFVCGDDLVWSDRSGLFTPKTVADTYVSVGCYLEFSSLEPRPLNGLNFVGTHCLYDGSIRYCYNVTKLTASAGYSKRGRPGHEQLAKLISLYTLVFNDPDSEAVRQIALRFLDQNPQINPAHPEVRSLLMFLFDPSRVRNLYDRNESGGPERPFRLLC